MQQGLKQTTSLQQHQTLAPMQLQFVRLLEMNNLEAEDEVRRALDDNPALEVAPDKTPYESDESDFNETSDQLQMADYRNEDDIPSYRLNAGNWSASAAKPSFEAFASDNSISLYDHLMSQLNETASLTPLQTEIAEAIIGNIDSNGYLRRSPKAIADDLAINDSLLVDTDQVNTILSMIRSLDPAGIGAADLRDCLLLQLGRLEPSAQQALATEVVRDYFDLFSLMHFDRICSLIGVDRRQLRQAVDIIRTLNPKPGALFSSDSEANQHITPDFIVESDGGDRLSLTVPSGLPHLQIEQSFAADTAIAPRQENAARNAAALFLKQKRDEATNFIRALEMRQQTLLRIMGAIMQWQREFFLTGDPTTLRPMVLKNISAVTGDDISVISRATAGKYVATRHGTYALKNLFNEARTPALDSDADSPSTAAMLADLKELIETENKLRPLSDEALTKRLSEMGHNIARRTVSKYREKLGYPVARLRKDL